MHSFNFVISTEAQRSGETRISTATNSTPAASRTFYPALDGLRALAFLAVFAVHYGVLVSTWQVLRWGWIGVDVFFVLSGFLITGILFDSLDQPRFFQNFYIRRTLRIFPLFYAFWLLMLVLTPFIGIIWNRYNLSMALYLGNFFRAGALAHLHPDSSLLYYQRLLPRGDVNAFDVSPLWSLCVEEQFYLVWPAIVWWLRSRNRLLALCLAVVLAGPFLRELYWRLSPLTAMHAATYFNTFTRIDTLLAGAAVALLLRGPGVSPRLLHRASYVLLVVPLAILALLLHIGPPPARNLDLVNNHTVNTIGLSLVALFAVGLLLLALHQGSWLFRLLRLPALAAMGRRSYGLYLFHAVPICLFLSNLLPRLRHHHVGFLFLPATLAYTFTAAWLSYRYLETPFLRLKDRFAATHPKCPEPTQLPPLKTA